MEPMIVIPDLLHRYLTELDSPSQQRLSLAFAQHVLEQCGDEVEAGRLASSNGYLAAATQYMRDRTSIDALTSAHEAYFRDRGNKADLSAEITWVVALAVAACFQRDLETAGALVHRSYVPTVSVVAREAQAAVAKCAAGAAGDQQAPGAALSRRAKWEEARWQLIRVIEEAPNPH